MTKTKKRKWPRGTTLDDVYNVERILGVRHFIEYMIKMDGFSDEFIAWVVEANWNQQPEETKEGVLGMF